MDRCHLYLPLIDSSGVTYPYAEVTLLDAESGLPVDSPVYLLPNGGAPQRWPVLVTPGVINLWTEAPMRVTVQALLPGGATFTRSGVDIAPAPLVAVRSDLPLRMLSAEGLSGEAILTVSPDGTAAWQVLDVLRFHEHRGDAPESTVLGSADLNDVYPGQTWLGKDPGGSQGTDAAALGADSAPDGDDAVVLGRAAAGPQSVAAGAGAAGAADTVAVGAGSQAPLDQQVVLGKNASASPDALGAVVVGADISSDAEAAVTVGGNARVAADGSFHLGQWEVPDLSWLSEPPSVVFLNDARTGRFMGIRNDAVLGGTASTVGFFGEPGGLQPMLSSSGLDPQAPGREALLSLLAALDQLGLIYLLDNALDDDLNDWTRTFAHTDTVLENGDADGTKAGDLSRAKRSGTGPGTITYQRTGGIRDFRFHAFTRQADGAPATYFQEVVAAVSADGVSWTDVPVEWQSLTLTTDNWFQVWAGNAHPLPEGMEYLRLTLDLNVETVAPQIGRVVIR